MATLLSGVAPNARAAEPPGKYASTPWQLGRMAWKQVLVRTWKEASDDNIGLVAAGVAFYGFLAMVPLLGSVVLLYGLVAEPGTVLHDVRALVTAFPTYAGKLLATQLVEIVNTSADKKGMGLVVAIGLALFGARNGAGAIITALNIAYEEEERRGTIMITLLALGITAAAAALGVIAVVAITALGHLQSFLPTLPGFPLALGKLLAYLVLLLGGAAGAATLYRYGPDRAKARWVWLTPGSIGAAIGWLLLTLVFGAYVARINDFSATYGSLSGIAVLLTWLYLSSYVLLLGAELNSELEHQTARDTTIGAEMPIGSREAWVANHVAGEEAPTNIESSLPASVIPAEVDVAPADRPRSIPTEALTIRTAGAFGRLAHIGRVTSIPSITAAGGLALLRQRGKTVQGGVLLMVAAILALLGRDRLNQNPAD